MKNLKMAFKLGLGFGLLVLIMCVLNFLAIRAMNIQEKGAKSIADVYMRELSIGVNVERAATTVMTDMLRYLNTDDRSYADSARKALDEIQEHAVNAGKLFAEHPELVRLGETLKGAQRIVPEYASQVEKTIQLQESLNRRLVTLAEAGEVYLSAINEMLNDQEQQLINTINNNEGSQEVHRRLKNTQRLNTLLDLGAAVRLSNMQSQIMHDSAIAEEGMKNFDTIFTLVRAIEDSVRRPAAKQGIRKIGEVATLYRDNFRILIDEWKAVQELNVTRTRNALTVIDLARTTARTGLEEVENLCNVSVTTSHDSAQMLVAGIVIGVLLSIVLWLLITRAITGPLYKTVNFATNVANGDLDKELDIHQHDEVGHLANSLNTMVSTLRQRISDAQEAIEKASAKEREALAAMHEAEEAHRQAEQAKRQGMLDAAGQLENVVAGVSSASDQLSAQAELSESGSQQQAARVSETATAMEEMNATVIEVAKNGGDTARVSDQAKQKAQAGADIVQQVINGMRRIQKGSEELRTDMIDLSEKATAISTIMVVISDIADQTNLLALNAAIEAARAGEAGRGFAVVADEVRKLAEKTMKATAEVGEAIQGIQQGTSKNMTNAEASVATVAEVTELAAQSGQALGEIVTLVDLASDQVRAIATASEQQSATSEEINRAVEDIAHISTETADAMHMAKQAVQELSRQAQILDRLIQDMKNS